jgi:predicted amino acid dehydrogenase
MTRSDDTFAFIIHPIDPQRDVARKYPALGRLPRRVIDFLSLFFPPVYISEISGARSVSTGRSIHGWFIACPLTPARMLTLPEAVVYRKIVQTGRLAEKLGARLLGLGAFTSVVGDGGITIANRLNIPVTTGDSYTVAIAVRAIREAARRLEIPLAEAAVAVVGGAGAIGAVAAELLAPDVSRMLLIGRHRREALEEVAARVRRRGCTDVTVSTNMSDLRQAQLIVTVTSAIDAIVEPQHLRRGAVICDVSRPRDVSRRVASERPDVLVIEGGMVEVPGPIDFGFNFGFPEKMAYACMAETMALTMDGRYESYTLGKNLTLAQVETIDAIAARHGFALGGFRSFERAITDAELAAIRRQWVPANTLANS